MVMPNPPAALRGFIEDEILRAPLMVEQVVEAAVSHLHKGMAGMLPRDRSVASELLQAVLTYRRQHAEAYVQSLRQQIAAGPGAEKAVAEASGALTPPDFLSLVDEDEVAIDVVISHTIEAIRSTCEHELRELQTYVSALVGDMEVTRDHNPFRAETHARALWASLQALPVSAGNRLTFMRHAGTPLAQVLRRSYAGASSRLEEMGIVPAKYRTVILPAGTRRARAPDTSFHPDLLVIRDAMPLPQAHTAPRMLMEHVLEESDAQLRGMPSGAGVSLRADLLEQQRTQLLKIAPRQVDQQLVELFGRLFEAMLTDRQLAPDIQPLLARLQAPALRVALSDTKLLEDRDHPVWRFLDRIAFQGDILPEPGDPMREQALRFVQGLVDHVAAEPGQEAPLYSWALERLRGHEQHRLKERAFAVSTQITLLQEREDRFVILPAATTMSGTLDVDEMDTVPAALIQTESTHTKPASSGQAWLLRRQAGDWIRTFLQGRWVHAQLLWPGERGELWLFGDAITSTTWAVRRRALITLHSEKLLETLDPRSLLVDAAKRVMRQSLRV